MDRSGEIVQQLQSDQGYLETVYDPGFANDTSAAKSEVPGRLPHQAQRLENVPMRPPQWESPSPDLLYNAYWKKDRARWLVVSST